MLKKFEQAYIKRMAKLYKENHPNITIRQAIHKAYEAYDIYRDTEVEMMYEERSKLFR